MRVSLIVAVGSGGVIGKDGGLPWRLPSDLRRFRKLTMGHHLVVGRRTWESIARPLPGRRMVVVSHHPETLTLPAGVQAARGLEEALRLAATAGDDEAFVAGGAALYVEALPRADRLYLTEVAGPSAGDTFIPPLDLARWREVEREELAAAEDGGRRTTFRVLERAASPPG